MPELVTRHIVKIEQSGEDTRYLSRLEPLSWSVDCHRAHEFTERAEAEGIARKVAGLLPAPTHRRQPRPVVSVRDWLLPP